MQGDLATVHELQSLFRAGFVSFWLLYRLPVCSAAMSWPIFPTLSFNCTLSLIHFLFFFLMDTISSLTGFGLSGGYSLGWMFWKSAGLTPVSSTWQFVLVCIARVCVSWGYMSACICLWTVLFFFFHDLTPYSVEEAETHWEPLHFLPYFFLLNVTMSLPNRLTHSEFSFHRK